MKAKLNNEGFSLVELLIALAVAGLLSLLIASMMTNGTNWFNQENDKIDIANETQIIKNQLSQKLMEAKTLNIVKQLDGTGKVVAMRVYTGELDNDSNKLAVEGSGSDYSECIITYMDEKLYVTSEYMESIADGFMLSSDIKEFDVNVAKNIEAATEQVTDIAGAVITEVDYYYTEAPLSIKVDMKISNVEREKDGGMTIKPRNKIKEIRLYEVSNINDELKGETPKVVKVK